jgi:predicted lipoprotein with Yx(FWY)xxD motif
MKISYIISAGLALVIAGIVVAVVAVSGGTARTAPHLVSGGSVISLRTTSLGKTLVDANGRTLYLFKADRPNVSTLSNAGVAVWPRFTATGAVKAGSGVQAAAIGTVTSPSGSRQVTYNGHPLYYYVGDSAPGSTKGQGLNEFGALWYVLGPGGSATTSAPAKAAPAGGASSAPSYGY